MNFDYLPMFSTGALISDLVLDSNIKEDVLNYEKTHISRKVSNVGGYQSNLIDMEEPWFKELKEKVVDAVNWASREVYALESSLKVGGAWVNINRDKEYNEWHIHDCPFSAVYYLDVPKDSGKICFESPSPLGLYVFGGMGEDGRSADSRSEFCIEPKSETLVIFNGFVRHRVEPNMSEKNRISIAMNLYTDKNYLKG